MRSNRWVSTTLALLIVSGLVGKASAEVMMGEQVSAVLEVVGTAPVAFSSVDVRLMFAEADLMPIEVAMASGAGSLGPMAPIEVVVTSLAPGSTSIGSYQVGSGIVEVGTLGLTPINQGEVWSLEFVALQNVATPVLLPFTVTSVADEFGTELVQPPTFRLILPEPGAFALALSAVATLGVVRRVRR